MSKRKRARGAQKTSTPPEIPVGVAAPVRTQQMLRLEKAWAWGVARLASTGPRQFPAVPPTGGYFRRNRAWLLPAVMFELLVVVQRLGLYLAWPNDLPGWVPVTVLLGMLACLAVFGYGLLRTRTATTAVVLRLFRSAIIFIVVVLLYQAIRRR